MGVTVLYQKATANYVPAAAVIRRWRALSGIIGLFIIHYRLLLANFGDIQIGLVASGIKNGDLNFRNKIPHPAASVK